jgi:MFS family permease
MTSSPTDGGPTLSAGVDPGDRLAPGVWKVVCVAAIGSFMAQLDATVVNVSLARLATELHASLATIQWVTSGYLLALALTLPLSAWLVDRIGAPPADRWRRPRASSPCRSCLRR